MRRSLTMKPMMICKHSSTSMRALRLTRKTLVTSVLLAACATASGGQSGPPTASCSVIPGKDIQVSNEFERIGDLPAYMFELQLALNPKNPKNMIASGIHVLGQSRDDPDYHHQEVLAFVSDDGGRSWRKTPLPPFPLFEGKRPFEGDPTVVFSKRGTAVYLTLARGRYAHLSTDGGKSWSAPISMIKEGFDHWMPAADTTNGPNAGNVYAWGMRTRRLKEGMEGNNL